MGCPLKSLVLGKVRLFSVCSQNLSWVRMLGRWWYTCRVNNKGLHASAGPQTMLDDSLGLCVLPLWMKSSHLSSLIVLYVIGMKKRYKNSKKASTEDLKNTPSTVVYHLLFRNVFTFLLVWLMGLILALPCSPQLLTSANSSLFWLCVTPLFQKEMGTQSSIRLPLQVSYWLLS